MPARALALPSPLSVVDSLPVYSTALASAVPLRFRASSNESAFPPPPAVVDAATAAIAAGNRYPAIHATDLLAALSAFTGRDSAEIATADGSLSLLQHLLGAFVRPDSSVVYAWRSYEAYPIAIALAGGRGRPVPLTAAHEHDLDAMADAVDDTTTAVILCNPNNPTGTAFGRRELERFLDAVPTSTLVIYDEAYRDFVDPARIDPFEATDLLAAHPNLVVLRTFSKVYSLAGLRVGYLVADEAVAGAVRRVLPPFPLSAVAVAAAIAALGEDDFRVRVARAVLRERDLVTTALSNGGYDVVPSSGNFVWLPIGDAAVPLQHALRECGIAIRAFPGEGARISVGEAGLADALAEALPPAPVV
ncbi:aminotransferase class I/II-fold pyridoxal phosphate-dependent enzyme [Planctomonas psychrotolerans]|uniref:aminotransferase class I/II-fold pyridoxal phosphate-dependent enzyme n=1 Tax=Planctomonas psychrotolerans TaxID=2528712 RepID=UPI00123BC348|nr:aminotransferase class I/II-fold pyridoxal phosphate-dependent enzyme [Planctomonas psychrotolerans]